MSSTTVSRFARTRARRRSTGALIAAGVLSLGLAGVASAKEITSGGGGGTATTACNPVSSLTYKGDATTSDTGFATIQIDWSAKSCTSAAVTAEVTMFESANPANVVYSDPNAPLSGRVTVGGVLRNHSYQARVDVFDAATHTLQGSKTIFVAAVYKGV